MTQKPVTAIILGAGHRAMAYAEYSLAHPDELQIVGVADPDERRSLSMQFPALRLLLTLARVTKRQALLS